MSFYEYILKNNNSIRVNFILTFVQNQQNEIELNIIETSVKITLIIKI